MCSAKYDQLTPSQKEAVFHKKGPALVLAGPGSGKTRVITYRISALIDSGVRPWNICAITFTNKAADEMRQRVIAIGVAAGSHISTFHSLCVRVLRRYADKAGINPNFSIYDNADQSRCMKQAVKDCNLDSVNFPPARMLDAVSALKNNLVTVVFFKADADDFFSKTLARIYEHYERILSEHNALDFDDLLMRTALLFDNCPDVCREIGERFKFLLIDEYQDTNYAQYKIAKSIVSGHNNIFVVGDPDQSIYRWRGADIRNILDFEKDWPGAVIISLEENFRSTPNILEPADKLIAVNKNRKEKKLIPTRQSGKDAVISVFEDEREEANAVAEKIKELAEEGMPLSGMAVFYRVNASSRVLEEAFIKNKIPYQVVRGVEFYNRKEIRDLLAYLKILANPSDENALLRIINTPSRGIGKTTIDRLKAYAVSQGISFFDGLKKAELIDSLPKAAKIKIGDFVKMIERFKKDSSGKVAPLAERIFNESGLSELIKSSEPEWKDKTENVDELINTAAYYDQQAEQPSLVEYLQQISLVSDVDAYDTAAERVALMTLHAAKGLEFEDVFIIGLEDGLLPHERTNTGNEDDLEEERRLFFVGITRAKTGLFISRARYRTIRGQLMRTVPSPFLYELGTDFAETASSCHSCGSRNPFAKLSDYADITTGIDDTSQILHDFVAGQLVRHKTFGLGRVKEFIDMGEDSEVVVKFNTGQTKSLMVKCAGLSKM
jgi:DNA helicase-2/ATP-dependent DNA helicase PcrA